MPESAVIESLAFGGSGVCRLDGKVCFVPYGCPGDTVELSITSRKKSYTIAEIGSIPVPSPHRVEPPCAVFGTCGGCSWQHVRYDAQLEQKRTILAGALWRGGRVPAELIEKVTPSAQQYGYRSRVQFKVSCGGGRLRIGFFRQGSHQVVDAASGCPLAAPVINRLLGVFRKLLTSFPGLRNVTGLTIDSGDEGAIVIIQMNGPMKAGDRSYFLEHTSELSLCSGLFVTSEVRRTPELLWGDPSISYSMGPSGVDGKDLVMEYPPGGFAQVHREQNRAMLSIVRSLGACTGTERLLDLYCGNGNFSLPLAYDVASVTGIESSAEAVKSAEANRVRNSVANARFFCDDVCASVTRRADQGERFDVVLLDPPRAGAGGAMAGIIRLNPAVIIYISCDPATLGRDVGLLRDGGYEVTTVVPVDMFPQTYHIESITLLRRM